MKKIEKHKFILSTGRELSFYNGIIGINEELEDIYEGYDGSIELKSFDFDNDVVEKINYTLEEIVEICDYAIDLWVKMKEKYKVNYNRDIVTPGGVGGSREIIPTKITKDVVNVATFGGDVKSERVSFPKITISKKDLLEKI